MLKQKLFRNQAGFAHTMLIVSLLVIVGVAAVGYRVFMKSHADTAVSNGVLSTKYGFLVQPDGSGMSEIMKWGASTPYMWSPDGNRLAYEINSTLYISAPVPTNSTTKGIYTNVDANEPPQWSPDGQWLLIGAVSATGPSHYMILHPDGSGVQPVSANSYEKLTWAADSSSLYAIKDSSDGSHPLCTLDLQGNEKSCSFDPCEKFLNSPNHSCVTQMSLSYDGTRMAFVMTDPTASSPVGQLYTSNLDGSNPTQVISDKGGINTYSVAWAPDGTQLAVSLFNPADKAASTYVVNKDSTNLHRVFWTSDGPSWQPVTAATTFKFVQTASCTVTNLANTVATGTTITPTFTMTNTGTVPIDTIDTQNIYLDPDGGPAVPIAGFQPKVLAPGASNSQVMTSYKVVSKYPTTAYLGFNNMYLTDTNPQTGLPPGRNPFSCGKTITVSVPTVSSVQVNPSDWQKLKSASIVTDSPKGNVVKLGNASGNEIDTSAFPNSSSYAGVLLKLDKFLEADDGKKVQFCATMRAGSSSTVKIDVMNASTTTSGITKSVSYSLGNSYATKCFDFTVGLIGDKTYTPGFGNLRMSVTGGSAAFIDVVTLKVVS